VFIGSTIYILHLVGNIGDGVSGETRISYYISNESPVDPTAKHPAPAAQKALFGVSWEAGIDPKATFAQQNSYS